MSGTFENAFRTQLSSWRTAGSGTPSSVGNSNPNSFVNKMKSLNPFGENSSIRLPTSEREAADPITVEEPEWFNLSRWDRLLIFGICLLGAVACFALCFLIMPVLALKPRKFAVLWSLGSLLFVISFGVLQGPVSYIKHLVSPNRLPFTIAFFGSIMATMIFSLGLKSTILTILAAITQIVAAIWYTVSYFPMGTQSLKFASRLGTRQVTTWINS